MYLCQLLDCEVVKSIVKFSDIHTVVQINQVFERSVNKTHQNISD